MDLIELIEKVGGIPGIQIQFLDQCAHEFKRLKKENRITFATEEDFSLKGTDKFGVVVWMDREKAKQAFIEARAKREDDDAA